MNTFKRGMVFVTFFGCCFGLALMAASLGTEFWFQAECVQRDVSRNASASASASVYITKASGKIHFGLFRGVKMLNWGIGDRTEKFSVKSSGILKLLNEALWIATIGTLSGALVFSVVAAIFAVVNTAMTPIECITGLPGLYLWNGLTALLGLACVLCWGVQHHLNLRANVLLEESQDGWTTEGLQSLGYSYWLVVVSVLIHIANCVLIRFGTRDKKIKTQYQVPEAKPGNIMLY